MQYARLISRPTCELGAPHVGSFLTAHSARLCSHVVQGLAEYRIIQARHAVGRDGHCHTHLKSLITEHLQAQQHLRATAQCFSDYVPCIGIKTSSRLGLAVGQVIL